MNMVIREGEVGAGVYNTPKRWSELMKIHLAEKQREKACQKRNKHTMQKE